MRAALLGSSLCLPVPPQEQRQVQSLTDAISGPIGTISLALLSVLFKKVNDNYAFYGNSGQVAYSQNLLQSPCKLNLWFIIGNKMIT
jgi:hypothetical protein